MRSAAVFASVLALATSVLAQEPSSQYVVIYFPQKDQSIPSGKTYTIEWDARELTGPATISLLGGNDPGTLQILDTIASVDVNDASYEWPVDCSLGEDKTYGLKIASGLDDGKTFQYSFPFHIKGPSCDNTNTTSSSSIIGSATASATTGSFSGYPTLSSTATVSSNGTSSSATKTATTSTVVKSSSTVITSTPTTLFTSATDAPGGTVTEVETSTETESTSATPTGASSTTPATSLPTAGAARAGAGLALGLLAAALAL
ncbi:Ser-Thr-rich glycosyl-phosphatidyl-inositol-anchored membrane family-domain-containing protein [Xylariaceae sp. AK1471]|nr:Ser-Thr-rich glycosyl-phosphatidyl-inositol-anchored membrane family-domain-containing protein [Xylariaceae sp. AK1471]